MEILKHECGIAMVRLLKPLEYFKERYGSWTVGLDELCLLMEKQHNRGQEGAGMASVKLEASPGEDYMFRHKALGTGAIKDIFETLHKGLSHLSTKQMDDVEYVKRHVPFAGDIYMGHLRYSTTGHKGLAYVHPFLRRNNWRARNLCLCGNFNMTNTDHIFDQIVAEGQHPRAYSDTYILLEQIGHRLDRESERCFREAKDKGFEGCGITAYIEEHIDMANVLRSCARQWDGGYVLCGMTGSGEMFVMRDPWGIRPAFWYKNDEQMVVASERPVIQTTLFVEQSEVKELLPGQALLVNSRGEARFEQILPPCDNSACSFERIYFSRGNDADIYRERKELGRRLVAPILQAIDNDIDHTVFSFIPNTAETAFYGMIEGFDSHLNDLKRQAIIADPALSEEALCQILNRKIRSEKIAWKDIKMRTFIAEGTSRNNLAAHVYDITYGSVEAGVDNLVVIDDSIVRGTTLKESILRILDRLHPRKIVIVSSSPQVRYPDYYGIDMPGLNEFIAFRATISLLHKRGLDDIITCTYHKCRQALDGNPDGDIYNYVQDIYAPFTQEDIAAEMVVMLKSPELQAEVEIVFQPLDALHQACGRTPGDWYFSGNYPTPGGLRRVLESFVDYYEKDFAAND